MPSIQNDFSRFPPSHHPAALQNPETGAWNARSKISERQWPTPPASRNINWRQTAKTAFTDLSHVALQGAVQGCMGAAVSIMTLDGLTLDLPIHHPLDMHKTGRPIGNERIHAKYGNYDKALPGFIVGASLGIVNSTISMVRKNFSSVMQKVQIDNIISAKIDPIINNIMDVCSSAEAEETREASRKTIAFATPRHMVHPDFTEKAGEMVQALHEAALAGEIPETPARDLMTSLAQLSQVSQATRFVHSQVPS